MTTDFYLPQVSANLSMAPDPAIIPSFFQQARAPEWHKAVSMVRSKYPSAPPRALWRACVQAFVELCDELKKNPYANRADANNRILSFLRTEKMRISKWLNNSGILKVVRVKRATHSSILNGSGFLVFVDGWLEPVPHNTVHSLLHSNFRWKRKDRAYVVEVYPRRSQVRLTNEAIDHPTRWHLSYVIKCPELPALEHYRLPTARQLELVIDKRIWPAITNFSRPRGGNGYRI